MTRPDRLLRSVLSLAVAVLALGGCASVPETGRSQLNLISRADELKLGEEAYAEQLQGAKLITSGPQYEMVKRVCERVATSADARFPEATREFVWEFRLIDDPNTVNAWALPGGKVAVYTGILTAADTEARLAAVVGHECAHAIARHGAERMSQNMAAEIILRGASGGLSFSGMSPAMQEGAMAALGVGSQVGVLLPFSRAQESEADEIGLFIAAQAGYDPREAVQLWKNMAAMGGSKPSEWLSTHPSDQTRIKRLETIMPLAMEVWTAHGGQP